MRLAEPLVRLPIRFSAEALAAEADALPASAWVPHPSGYDGNDAALLVTPKGGYVQGFLGEMAPTEIFGHTAYVRQIMATLGATWGRSRFMRLAPGARVLPHIDTHYYWRTHWRLHIPVVTEPEVRFTCGERTVHMAPGECWLFDSFQPHEVHNGSQVWRVHLVLDTVGGGQLWDLLKRAESADAGEPEFVTPRPGSQDNLLFERHNVPVVMTPWEVRCHVGELLGHCAPSPALPAVEARLDRFIDSWTAAWAAHGEDAESFGRYLDIVLEARDDLHRLGADTIRLANGVTLFRCLRDVVFRMAVTRPEREPSQEQAMQPRPVR